MRRRRIVVWVATLILSLGIACGAAPQTHTSNLVIVGVEPFAPTPIHAAAYAMTAACVGTGGDLEAVAWARARVIVDLDTRRLVLGAWVKEPRRIILDRTVWIRPDVISHEVMHDLLRGDIPPTIEQRCTIR